MKRNFFVCFDAYAMHTNNDNIQCRLESIRYRKTNRCDIFRARLSLQTILVQSMTTATTTITVVVVVSATMAATSKRTVECCVNETPRNPLPTNLLTLRELSVSVELNTVQLICFKISITFGYEQYGCVLCVEFLSKSDICETTKYFPFASEAIFSNRQSNRVSNYRYAELIVVSTIESPIE